MISYHNGSVSKALFDLFPAIGLDKVKMGLRMLLLLLCFYCYYYLLLIIIVAPYSDLQSRRHFFEKYAEENGFDYNNAENWYSHSKSSILSQKVHFYLYYEVFIFIVVFRLLIIIRALRWYLHIIKITLLML